jgi:hypothetical protein
MLDPRPARPLTRHECQVLIDAYLDAIPASEESLRTLRDACSEVFRNTSKVSAQALLALDAVHRVDDVSAWTRHVMTLGGTLAGCSNDLTVSDAFKYRDAEPSFRSDMTSREVAELMAGYLASQIPQLGVVGVKRHVREMIGYFKATPAALFQSVEPIYSVCMQLIAMAGQSNVLEALRWCEEHVEDAPPEDVIEAEVRKMLDGGSGRN